MIWSPTRCIGWRHANGSWKIIAMSLPRRCRASSLGRTRRGCARPSRRISPLEVTCDWRLRSPISGEARDALARPGLADDAQRLVRDAACTRDPTRHWTSPSWSGRRPSGSRTSRRVVPSKLLTRSARGGRGTRTAMSTTRFMNTTATAPTMTTPTTVGRSWLNVEVDREPAEALDVEDRLGDDRPADEEGDVDPEHRDDWGQARPQGVRVMMTAPLRETLRARGSDVVLSERLEQACYASSGRRSPQTAARARSRAGSCARRSRPGSSVIGT